MQTITLRPAVYLDALRRSARDWSGETPGLDTGIQPPRLVTDNRPAQFRHAP